MVLVDLLRGYPTALSWIEQQSQLGVTPMVWLEILEGAVNRQEQQRAIKLLNRFQRLDPQPEDYDWAIRQALALRLSHNVDVMDCLIAACAHRLQLPLFTTNLKHFAALLGPLAHKPY
jgi:predicted nucleic acid-binding protein